MSDERRGVPSASALGRLDPEDGCPASFLLGQEAERRGMAPEPAADGQSGTRVHKWLETETDEDWRALDADEQETALMCQEQVEQLADEFVDLDSVAPHRALREVRLGLTRMWRALIVSPKATTKFVVTGKSDRLYIQGTGALVVDFKTSRGPTPHASVNKQLLGLAVLPSLAYHLDTVRVAIVQPWAGKPTVAEYGQQELDAAFKWLVHTAANAMKPGQTPQVGDYCHWCPARLICPAFNAAAVAPASAIQPATLPAEKAKEAIFARVHEFNGGDIAAILDDPRLKYVGWLAAAAKSVALKRLEENPESVPGWEIREVSGKRKIADPATAAALVEPLLIGADGGPDAALIRASELRPRVLEEEIRKASGKKGKLRYNLTATAATEAMEQKLGGLLTAPIGKRLARIGAQLEEESEL